ncbi:MAG: hypothetical protein HYS12_20925 [Planctomycetes bacterium]|nr:hypothetical protein [Planctomycetota bacterium]
MSKPSVHSECSILDEFVTPPPTGESRKVVAQQAGGNIGCLIVDEFVSGTPPEGNVTSPADANGEGGVLMELAAQVARQFDLPPASATDVVRQVWGRVIEVLRQQLQASSGDSLRSTGS